MGRIKNGTRPQEVMCYYPIDIGLSEDEPMYFHVVFDTYSQFVFNLGTTTSNDINAVRECLPKLFTQKEFDYHYGNPFTMVVHKYEEHKDELQSMVEKHNGEIEISDLFVTKHMVPLMKELFNTVSKRMK